MKPWYEEFFENFAEQYDREPFVQGTLGEADFIEREINFDKSVAVLDIGCGTGRHAIELARRGYRVTGIDLSEAQLNKARRKARQESLKIDFIRKDARDFHFDIPFGLVVMVCEGAFPLMETDEMNFAILQNAAKALKPEGTLIFTTLNGLFPLFHSVKDFINSHSEGERHKAVSFDLMTFRDHSEFEHVDDDGNKKILKCNERYYVPSEITWLLKTLGFKSIEISGCEPGKWDRARKLTTEDYEMLVVARK
jgi:2-polyprenyl-3-methyl-5-hydroxy-6-metoxy-1,4-benzoquinol methylase